jgi:hypothetical protein
MKRRDNIKRLKELKFEKKEKKVEKKEKKPEKKIKFWEDEEKKEDE